MLGDVRKISAGNGVPGIDETKCIYSESWDEVSNSALTPDNYLVTDGLYSITDNSTLSFYAKPVETAYYMEHYGVAVSTDGVNFTTLWQHSVTINEAANWTLQTIDLSNYAGRNIYIAFRHFNSSNEHAICIDNIELTSGNRSTKSSTIENQRQNLNQQYQHHVAKHPPVAQNLQYDAFLYQVKYWAQLNSCDQTIRAIMQHIVQI